MRLLMNIPTELIHLFMDHLSLPDLLRLSRASRRCRELVDRHPTYWSRISVQQHGVPLSMPMIDLAITRLERSSFAPVLIDILWENAWFDEPNSCGSECAYKLVAAIRANMHRVGRLRASADGQLMNAIIDALIEKAPRLELLELESKRPWNLSSHLPSTLHVTAPNLRRLHLDGIGFTSSPESDGEPIVFPRMREYSVQSWRVADERVQWPDLDDLHRVFPHLENLTFRFGISHLLAAIDRNKRLAQRLARLKFLELVLDLKPSEDIGDELAECLRVIPTVVALLPTLAAMRLLATHFPSSGDLHMASRPFGLHERSLSFSDPSSGRVRTFRLDNSLCEAEIKNLTHRVSHISVFLTGWDRMFYFDPYTESLDTLTVTLDIALCAVLGDDSLFDGPKKICESISPPRLRTLVLKGTTLDLIRFTCIFLDVNEHGPLRLKLYGLRLVGDTTETKVYGTI
ncbi:hypothetical protein EXIGLDRAFT_727285 [Exidia glandulosa HHB12029]|uniref:F-box domain-containing protein n=1 Tax=Exidia glandulosa HHB12029 TaxID=1314781 RepID=A0A165DEG9_EXIGL|nr:hypothetical protein EXIGLDRAFT_727285 [Exidia glandulosa HHB12029]